MTYQQIIIVGNIGRDPELRYTPSGIAVTDFSLATSRRWTDQSGQRQERTTWWRVTCWRRQAEVVAQYAKKGRQVMVIGTQIEANAFTGRDGEARASLDLTADEVRFLGGRDDVDTSSVDAASGGYPQDNDFAAPPRSSGGGSGGPSEDDIPF